MSHDCVIHPASHRCRRAPITIAVAGVMGCRAPAHLGVPAGAATAPAAGTGHTRPGVA